MYRSTSPHNRVLTPENDGCLHLADVRKREARSTCAFPDPARDGENPLRLIIGLDVSPAAEQAIYTVGQRVWPAGTEVRLIAVDDGTRPLRIASRLPQAAAMINGYFQNKESRVTAMLEWGNRELRAIGLRTSVVIEKGDAKSILWQKRKNGTPTLFSSARAISKAVLNDSGWEAFRPRSLQTRNALSKLYAPRNWNNKKPPLTGSPGTRQ